MVATPMQPLCNHIKPYHYYQLFPIIKATRSGWLLLLVLFGSEGNRAIRNKTVRWSVSAASANTGCYYDYSIPITLTCNLCNFYFLNLLHVRQNPASSTSIGLSAFITILPAKGYSPPIHSGISGLYPMVWQAGHSFIHF